MADTTLPTKPPQAGDEMLPAAGCELERLVLIKRRRAWTSNGPAR